MRKENLRRIGALIAAAAMVSAVTLTPVRAMAQTNNALIDLNARVGLTLTAVSGSTAVNGMTYRVYRIADVDAAGNYTVTDAIKAAYPNVNTDYTKFTAQNWVDYSATMANNLRGGNIAAADSKTTDTQGRLVFDSGRLSAGIYLVVGDSVRIGTNTWTTMPFVVSLPNRTTVGGSWTYNVTATPKLQVTPDGTITPPPVGNVPPPVVNVPPPEYIDTTPPGQVLGVTRTPEPGPDVPEVTGTVLGASRLPQTGLLWWPVPVMFFAGSAMLLYGNRIRENERVRIR